MSSDRKGRFLHQESKLWSALAAAADGFFLPSKPEE
jgi:hypothetical protein